MRIATKRAVLLQAWRAAQMRLARGGATELAADEEAGRLLSLHGYAIAAHTLCELVAARELLEEVLVEEGAYAPRHGRSVR